MPKFLELNIIKLILLSSHDTHKDMQRRLLYVGVGGYKIYSLLLAVIIFAEV